MLELLIVMGKVIMIMALLKMLPIVSIFKKHLRGKGSTFIVSKDGRLITYDTAFKSKKILQAESIYSYFAGYDVLSTDKLQSLREKFTKQKKAI